MTTDRRAQTESSPAASRRFTARDLALVAAYVVGLVTERIGAPYSLPGGFFANVVGGVVVLYVFGILGIMAVARVGIDTATTSVAIFIPGDLVKALVAALVARGVHAGYP